MKRKQHLQHADFAAIRARARVQITPVAIAAKIDRAVEDVRAFCRGREAAYAWSGGKDSVVLALVAELAGVRGTSGARTFGRAWTPSRNP